MSTASKLQDINLLPSIYVPKNIPLSGHQIIRYAVYLTFFFTFIVAVQIWYLENTKTDEKKALQLLATVEKHLQDFQQNHQQPTLDKNLENSIKAIREKLITKKDLLQKVSGITLADKPGFSNYLVGLAKYKTQDLWLTEFHIKDNGHYIRIYGNTLQPENLPNYLKALKQSPAFSGKIFDEIKLEHNTASNADIQFSLSLGEDAIEQATPDNAANSKSTPRPTG